jgi:N-acetylglucosaminyldiphosphoundecaprenol N-acetyl-beta-D-mannosaminyltransferase
MKQPALPEPALFSILGVSIHQVDFSATLTWIAHWINNPGACRQICTVNPEFVVDARRDPAFAAVLAQAELCVPDGVGVLWAARLQGVQLHERVTGSDGLYRICDAAAQAGWRVFFLGAAPGVAARAAQQLQLHYPGLQVAGTYSGDPTPAAWPAIQAELVAAQPHILFVAFGHPRQDFWIQQHRVQLPAGVAIGVGGAFDFAAGTTVRAPRWVRRVGLEWLHRLIRQPWRWRRMRKLPLFVLWVLWAEIKAKWSG